MVTVTDKYGAKTTDTLSITVKSTVSVKNAKKQEIEVYPNPGSGIFILSLGAVLPNMPK